MAPLSGSTSRIDERRLHARRGDDDNDEDEEEDEEDADEADDEVACATSSFAQ